MRLQILYRQRSHRQPAEEQQERRVPLRNSFLMRGIRSTLLIATLFLTMRPGIGPHDAPQGAVPVRSDDLTTLHEDVKRLEEKLKTLPTPVSDLMRPKPQAHGADAELFCKAAVWALRYEPVLAQADRALIQRAIARGNERADALVNGKSPWTDKRGRLVRGYVSTVDGSVQLYGLVIPQSYNPAKPIRLDVVLHGSTHPTGMSELRFLTPFDEGDVNDKAKTSSPDNPYIELHPLGRVENCYRWAGETDVFEAIQDVCRNYNIDRRRIVLRGMSMGASGTWHLGLKHPDRFVALGPYCGYVDTHRFSETPGMNFVKVGPLPSYQERGLHMLDSVDYAANAAVVPAIAAIGDRDPFFQAHVIMGEAMRREGLQMVNLLSPGTGHVQDPATFGEQMRRIGQIAASGLDTAPKRIRFVTWTLKYSRCHWIELLGLGEHYARAELEASVREDGTVDVTEPKNVTRFAILEPMLQGEKPILRVGGQEVRLPARRAEEARQGVVIARRAGRWTYAGPRENAALTGKRPGLQGPIDDAFTTPFLCVRGTGKAWNPAVQAWADANLKRFAYEWSRYFRGEVRIKDDTDITDADRRNYNLILFGDPGSNRWIQKALPSLPLRWTREELRFGGHRYSASDHAPALIYPSPFTDRNSAPDHYIVLNSGHTFHEAELDRLNYLLFPRLGDWAILKIDGSVPASPSSPLPEEPLEAGFFDEDWKVARPHP